MKNHIKFSFFSFCMVLLVVAFQNCGNDVGFSEKPSIFVFDIEDMSWTSLESSKNAVTTDIKRLDWNNDGIDDMVFSYNSGANKITEVCMGVRDNRMQTQCYALGHNSQYNDEGTITNYNDNVNTVSLAVADMDNDGKLDVVEFNSGKNIDSYIIYNRGVSNGVPQYERKSFHRHAYSSSLRGNLIDYDNDGKLDIAFVEMVVAGCTARDPEWNCTSWNISANGNSGSPVTLKLIVVKNQANISATSARVNFDLPNTYKFNGEPNLYNKSLRVQKINATSSNRNELLFINDRFENHYIVRFLNQQPQVQLVEKPEDQYIGNYWTGIVGDVDKDGHDDFINLCSAGPNSTIYFGKNDKSFDRQILDDSCGLFGANIQDINMDGYNDIVGVQYTNPGAVYSVVVYYGFPNRTFSGKQVIREDIGGTYELGTPIEFINLDGNIWMDFVIGMRSKDLMMLTNKVIQ